MKTNRIINQIKFVLEDYKLKIIENIKLIGDIILVIISIFIIGVGGSMIYNAEQEQIRSNTIEIFPLYSPHGYIIPLENISQKIEFNSSDPRNLPDYLPENIEIDIDYKEPVMRGDYINLNQICVNVRDISQDEAIQTYKIDLSLYGGNSFIGSSSSNIFNKNITNYQLNESEYEFYKDIISEGPVIFNMGRSFTLGPKHKFCEQYGGKPFTFIEPNSDNEFVFNYILYISNESTLFFLDGKAELYYPIKSATQTEELNTKTNKKILILTGWLLILGSFPFVLSIKQFILSIEHFSKNK